MSSTEGTSQSRKFNHCQGSEVQVRLTEVISSNSSRAEAFEYLQISLAAEPISGLAYTDGTADIRADQENTIFSATNKTNEESASLRACLLRPELQGIFCFSGPEF